eukprot:scaffold22148_cov18-Tisochrysis_lutea.AAC.1
MGWKDSVVAEMCNFSHFPLEKTNTEGAKSAKQKPFLEPGFSSCCMFDGVQMKAEGVNDAKTDIAILTHSTTIQPRYQAVIHCEIIRQAAQVVAMDHDLLRSGDRACVRFRPWDGTKLTSEK